MKTVSVSNLRYDFATVESMMRSGEEIRIAKRGKVIARLIPEPAARPPLPDFLGQMRANFGDRILEVTGAEIISADREDRF